MNVDDVVAAKVAAARARAEQEKKRRLALTAARQRGLAARHAQKLRNLARRRPDETAIGGTLDPQLLESQENLNKES